jgi:hypothetical protein
MRMSVSRPASLHSGRYTVPRAAEHDADRGDDRGDPANDEARGQDIDLHDRETDTHRR